MIDISRLYAKGIGQHVDAVCWGWDGLCHRLQILATRCCCIVDHLEGRANLLCAQVLSLYPQGIVIVRFLRVFCIRYGICLGEEAQIDAAAHSLVAFGIQVQPVVLEQELLLHPCRVLRIAYGMVEVYYAVQHLCRTNPVVDGSASLLVVFRIIANALERGNGATEDVDALLMGFANNLLVHLYNLLGCLSTIACIA